MCPNWVCVSWCVVFTGTRDITLLGKISYSYTPHTNNRPGHAFTIIHHADSEVRSGNGDDVRTRYTHSLGQETETE